jgi:hypothetical protein
MMINKEREENIIEQEKASDQRNDRDSGRNISRNKTGKRIIE